MLAHKAALTELVYALLQGMVVAFQCVALGRREPPLSSHTSSSKPKCMPDIKIDRLGVGARLRLCTDYMQITDAHTTQIAKS